jgi:hypothetical protein
MRLPSAVVRSVRAGRHGLVRPYATATDPAGNVTRALAPVVSLKR